MTNTTDPNMTDRRKFLKGGAIAGAAAVGTLAAPSIAKAAPVTLKMQAAGGGRRYLGKKLIARAYMLSRGKDEVEAQRFAEKAARTGFRPVKTPMPDEQQLRQLAQSTQELENRYA